MMKRDSDEWYYFLRKLKRSKAKSNRDVLCLECWKIYNYEGNARHKMQWPSHKGSIVTTKGYAEETLFIQLARALKKSLIKDGEEFFENPYEENIELKVPMLY